MSKTFLLVAIGLVLVGIYIGIIGMSRWGDTAPPDIEILQPFRHVGPTTPLTVRISDPDTGLQNISIRIIHNRQTYVLAEESFASHGALSMDGGTTRTYDFETIPYADATIPKKPGETTVVITARDYSWRNLFEGNSQRLTQDFSPKFTPPRLELLLPPVAMAQGGSGVIRYRASSDAARHGVRVNDAFFPGYATPGDSDMFALIAFPYNAPAQTPIQLVAADAVGNQAVLDVDIPVKAKHWRTRHITISDRFIRKAVLPIIAHTAELEEQASLLENFVAVNNRLRHINNQAIREFSKRTQPTFLWETPFRQLPGSQVEAAFADHRNYLYNKNIVDTQTHLGFDLAITKQYPIQASNDGVAVFAGYLGIYGNTIILDHGYGLQTLYAHLSSFAVKRDDQVAIGQTIGHSGTTGLAAGDHLHFSMVLHGEHVNPTEWWDPHWVQTRIRDRLGLPAPPPMPEQELTEPVEEPEDLGPDPMAPVLPPLKR